MFLLIAIIGEIDRILENLIFEVLLYLNFSNYQGLPTIYMSCKNYKICLCDKFHIHTTLHTDPQIKSLKINKIKKNFYSCGCLFYFNLIKPLFLAFRTGFLFFLKLKVSKIVIFGSRNRDFKFLCLKSLYLAPRTGTKVVLRA